MENKISNTPINYDVLLGTVNDELTSKYHGVCWFAKKNKWKASILIKNTHIYLGIYANEAEAAFAFNVAFELFTNGKHTITNHVELGDIQANDVRDSVIERMLNKGYIAKCLTVVMPRFSDNLKPPFRVGRKRGIAVLDSTGQEVVIFPKGREIMAQNYCDFLNGA